MGQMQTSQLELEALCAQLAPVFLEYLRSKGTAVNRIEEATTLEGITSLPARYSLGGVEKNVLAPLKLLTKGVDEKIEECETATARANTAADSANAAATEANTAAASVGEKIEECVTATAKANIAADSANAAAAKADTAATAAEKVDATLSDDYEFTVTDRSGTAKTLSLGDAATQGAYVRVRYNADTTVTVDGVKVTCAAGKIVRLEGKVISGLRGASGKELAWCNLSHISTSKVTNMGNMFFGCSSLTDIRFGAGWGKQTSTAANALTLDLSYCNSSGSYKLSDATWSSMLTMHDRATAGLTAMTIKLKSAANIPSGWGTKMAARGYTITKV